MLTVVLWMMWVVTRSKVIVNTRSVVFRMVVVITVHGWKAHDRREGRMLLI